MGVYLHYQAMPDDGRLARLLRTVRPMCAMYCGVIHRPAGPWDADRLPHDEFDEVLADIARDPAFGTLPAALQAYGDLRAELERAERERPGLRGRAAYFKLIDFDQLLAAGLADAGWADAGPFADSLVWGHGPFAFDGFGGGDVQLRYVPPAMVAEAVEVIQGLRSEPLAEWPDAWDAFRAVYAAAATCGEGVVIA